MFYKKCTISSILLLQVGFLCLSACTSAIHVKLGENFLLDYNLTTSEQIEFKIQAINVTGWVGLGINDKSGSLNGSDLYVGGVNTSANPVSFYGEDCHVPANSTNSQPIRDTLQNWNRTFASETNGTTRLTLTRLLNTTDEEHDLVIQNKTMYIIWLYNNVSDDRTVPSTHRGSISINLLAAGENDDGNDGGSDNGKNTAASNFAFTKNAGIFVTVSLAAIMMSGNF